MADRRKHVLSIVGARPQFMKLAAIVQAARRCEQVQHSTLHTGQHYDDALSGVFFRELGLDVPDIMLQSGSGSHGAQTGRMLAEIEEAVLQVRPDIALVYGDTNTTVAGALACKKLGVPIGHVEAGVRSRDRWAPEEINRRVTDALSDWLFAPTELSLANLSREGVPIAGSSPKVSPLQLPLAVNTGDVMLDTFLRFVDELEPRRPDDEEFVLATIHRAENTDVPERLQQIVDGLSALASEVRVRLPLHPRTADRISSLGLRLSERVEIEPPLPYREMLRLERDARAIITDSGGVQREAYWFGTPCVTVLDDTCWPETLIEGANVLIAASSDALIAEARAALEHGPAARTSNAFGNGRAAEEIVALCAGPWAK